MSRQLPIVDLEGSKFLVDLRTMEFREQANPANRISMLELQNQGDHLTLLYDPKTRNAWRGETDGQRPPSRVRHIRLPSLYQLDPFMYTILNGRKDDYFNILDKAAKVFETMKNTDPLPQQHKLK